MVGTVMDPRIASGAYWLSLAVALPVSMSLFHPYQSGCPHHVVLQ